MKGKRFTPEDVDLIRTLADAEWTDAEIGVRIGRSTETVTYKRRSEGITAGMARRYTDEEVTTIQEMVSNGKSSREIAKHLRRSKDSIANKRLKTGVLAPEMGPQSFKSQALRDAHVVVLQERRAKRRAERAGQTSGVPACRNAS